MEFGADLGNGLHWGMPNVASFGRYSTADEVHVGSVLLSKGQYVGSYSWNGEKLFEVEDLKSPGMFILCILENIIPTSRRIAVSSLHSQVF